MVVNRTTQSQLAEKILKATLKRKELQNCPDYVEVLNYESADEKGYCLSVNSYWKVCFSRSGKNGDHVVVYSGNAKLFHDNYDGAKFNKYHFNVPESSVQKKVFMFDDLTSVAKYVVKCVQESATTLKLQEAFDNSTITYPLAG